MNNSVQFLDLQTSQAEVCLPGCMLLPLPGSSSLRVKQEVLCFSRLLSLNLEGEVSFDSPPTPGRVNFLYYSEFFLVSSQQCPETEWRQSKQTASLKAIGASNPIGAHITSSHPQERQGFNVSLFRSWSCIDPTFPSILLFLHFRVGMFTLWIIHWKDTPPLFLFDTVLPTQS